MDKTYTGIQLMVGAREQLQSLTNKLKELEEWSCDKKNHAIGYHLSRYDSDMILRGTIYGYKLNSPQFVKNITDFMGFFNSNGSMIPFKMNRDTNGIYTFDKKVEDRMEFTNPDKFKEVADSLLHDDFAKEIELRRYIKQEPNYASVEFNNDNITIRNKDMKCEYNLNTECIDVRSYEPFDSDILKEWLDTPAMDINSIRDVRDKEIVHDYKFGETDEVTLGVEEILDKIMIYKI